MPASPPGEFVATVGDTVTDPSADARPAVDAAPSRRPRPRGPAPAAGRGRHARPTRRAGWAAPAGTFAGFDGLRAIAALGVLVCHVGLQSGLGRPQHGAGPWLSRADVGVALFFVLSGFLLYRPFVAARIDGGPARGNRRYLRNRFLRIFPAYWLALTVLAVVVDTRARQDISGWWDIVVYYGLLQSYSKPHALGGLQQAWTLVNEMAFYLLLPLWAAVFAGPGAPAEAPTRRSSPSSPCWRPRLAGALGLPAVAALVPGQRPVARRFRPEVPLDHGQLPPVRPRHGARRGAGVVAPA